MPNDVNAIATLIKVHRSCRISVLIYQIWYRELPTPVLNGLPSEKIFCCGSINDCLQSFSLLAEPFHSLLDWLLDLLFMVACNRRVNKMTAQNLG